MRIPTTTRRRRERRSVRNRRTSGGSGDPPSGIANQQVSLANIATAFLSERKVSSHRQSSTRRKKRLTTKSVQGSTSSRHSSYATTADDILTQRSSTEDIQSGFTTLLVPSPATTNTENKHRSATLFIPLTSSEIILRVIRTLRNPMKSTTLTRVHLTSREEQEQLSRRISFDFNGITSKMKLPTNQSSRLSTKPDRGRGPRFSSLSSSYAQFLKQQDMDKNKKVLSQEDHRLLLSSSEWVEDVRDSDPYVSILSRLGEAIQDSETYMEFVKKSFIIITNTIIATGLLILLTIFQVILFFMGVKYLNDCPVQPNLPVYLLVVGSMGLVRVLDLLWKQFRRRRLRKLEGVELDQEEEPETDGSDFTDAVLNLFLFGWFIVGQFWTWPVYMPKFEFGEDDPGLYCHRNVYIFTLVHIAFVYVMCLVSILFLIALTCCARFPHLIVKNPR